MTSLGLYSLNHWNVLENQLLVSQMLSVDDD